MDNIQRFEQLKESLREKLDALERMKGQKEMLEKTLKKDFSLTVEEAEMALPKMKKKLEKLQAELKSQLDQIEEALDGQSDETSG